MPPFKDCCYAIIYNIARYIHASQLVTFYMWDIFLGMIKRDMFQQELTYDYGYRLDSVADVDGKIKQLPCYCGEATCRKRLYQFGNTGSAHLSDFRVELLHNIVFKNDDPKFGSV